MKTTTRECPRPGSLFATSATSADTATSSRAVHPAAHAALRPALSKALAAAALAALAACGGGGGGDPPAPPPPPPSAPANQAPTVSLTAPAANATITFGQSVTLTATAADSDGTIARVEFFDGAIKLGEDTTAPYEFTWANASVGAHTLIARATDNAGATASSASTNFVVNPVVGPPPPNTPPTVAITSPANNFKPNDPATMTLVASANDADGTVAKVEFFRINPAAPVFDGSTLIGAGTAVGMPPTYQRQVTYNAGTYTFAARATDNAGAVTTSATVQVVVNALPTVSITSPTAGANLAAGSNVTLRATASDSDGTIARVDFFLDGSTTPLGQATRVGTTTEYTLVWNNVPAGPRTLVARATDNDGATRSTASLAVNGAANVAPVITLDAPTAGTNAPTNLVLTASASDSDGTIASVQFFNGTTSLGNGTFDAATSKYRLQVAISAAQAGTYNITARATDNGGAQTTTASRSITIAANGAPAVALTSSPAVTMPVPSTVAQASAATAPPATVLLTATASDSDGIAKVDFFNGATLIGTATTAPYQFSWTGVAANSYSITARATDTVGTTSTTPVQTLVVAPNVEGPWAHLLPTQRAGFTLPPDKPVEAGGVAAVQVMTALGVNTVIPAWFAPMAHAAATLARALPTTTTPGPIFAPTGPCTSGSVQVAPAAGANRQVILDSCTIGAYTFHGGGGLGYYQEDTTTSTTAVPPATVPVHPNPGCVLVTAAPRRWYCPINSAIDWEPVTSGGVTVGFRIILQGVRVTGFGTPHPGGKDWPRNAFTYTRVTCTGSGAAQSCITDFAATFRWGNDIAWAGWTPGPIDFGALPLWRVSAGIPTVFLGDPPGNFATDDSYTLNGLYRSTYCSPGVRATPALCLDNPPTFAEVGEPALRYNIRYENFTQAAGRTIVYGSNGWAVVTRLAPSSPGVERVQLRRFLTAAITAGGTTYPAGASGPETYRCIVGASSGDWECTQIPNP